MKKPQLKRVYILHGWAIDPDNERKWQALRALLASAGIETVFLPIPGLSSPLPDPDKAWTLADYLGWLEKELPLEPVLLLGHSFGGQLAVKFSAKFPKRIRALILIASSGIRDASLKARLKRTLFYMAAKVGKVFSSAPMAQKILYTLAREKDYLVAPAVMKKTMSNLLAAEIKVDLPMLSAPTLVIWGAADTITPLRNTALFRQIPNVEVQIITAARHSPQFTHPELVAQHITDFLKRVVTD